MANQQNPIRDLIFGEVDTRIKQMLLSPELQQQVRSLVQDTVQQFFEGPQMQAAILNAVQFAIAGGAQLSVPTPADKPPTTSARKRVEAPTKQEDLKFTRANGQERTPRPCRFVGCKRPHRSMGWCSAHYQSARKHGWEMGKSEPFHPPADYKPRT